MSRQFTTRAQVSGYRFGLARAEHALVRREARMLHDPLRNQRRALLAGAVLAVLILAGAGIYGIVRPEPTVGDARIVAADSGALYVLLDDALHPVPNLASARLILGEALPVRRVSQRSLAGYRRGPELGIVGAPSALPVDGGATGWTVCDDPGAGTAVLVGELPDGGPPTADAALVHRADELWLLYPVVEDGHRRPVRARIDPAETAVLRALGVEGAVPREVSPALLNTFPVRPPLTVPEVDRSGAPGPGALAGYPVGGVVATLGVDDVPEYFAVLHDGVQPLNPVAADALRRAANSGDVQVPRLAPGALTALTVRHRLAVDHFPAGPPRLATAADVLCRSWTAVGAGPPAERLLATATIPVPDGGTVMRLVSADGAGPGLDGVYLRPGSGRYVRTGADYYVSDAGVRYPLTGEETAQLLGLGEQPAAAPWEAVSLLPAGPELNREAALVARDAPG